LADEYRDGKRDAQIESLFEHLRELEIRTDQRFQQIHQDLELVKRIFYLIAAIVTVANVAGTVMSYFRANI